MDNLTAHKASEYDQKVRQTIPFYDTIHAEVLRLVQTVKPDVKCWVDTGCGTGHLVRCSHHHPVPSLHATPGAVTFGGAHANRVFYGWRYSRMQAAMRSDSSDFHQPIQIFGFKIYDPLKV